MQSVFNDTFHGKHLVPDTQFVGLEHINCKNVFFMFPLLKGEKSTSGVKSLDA